MIKVHTKIYLLWTTHYNQNGKAKTNFIPNQTSHCGFVLNLNLYIELYNGYLNSGFICQDFLNKSLNDSDFIIVEHIFSLLMRLSISLESELLSIWYNTTLCRTAARKLIQNMV